MKFRVIVADCPWGFSDSLTMNDVKRGAAANYSTLSIADLKSLPVSKIAEDESLLVMWVPSSLLPEGLDVMKAWGFDFKQTYIWVKTKQDITSDLIGNLIDEFKDSSGKFFTSRAISDIKDTIKQGLPKLFNANAILAFGMGRIYRQTHEIAIIGTRGKIYRHLQNKSQRSVSLSPATKHSTKPEDLQNALDLMFPGSNKLEIFARRDRNQWTCIGNEAPNTKDEDIRVSLEKLLKPEEQENNEDSTS
jgi:N6-adenosine-specific RNA methylase IME4